MSFRDRSATAIVYAAALARIDLLVPPIAAIRDSSSSAKTPSRYRSINVPAALAEEATPPLLRTSGTRAEEHHCGNGKN